MDELSLSMMINSLGVGDHLFEHFDSTDRTELCNWYAL